MKHKETWWNEMKKERRIQRNCIVNHPPMKQNERQKKFGNHNEREKQ